MPKHKAPSPQELYRQRRLQEEQERTAYLPPGLINHGNTCFMNSVLQGLIATRLLSDLVHFAPISPATQERSSVVLAAQKSPQLTNGHNLGGPLEQPWVKSMPIGDMFLSVIYKAWDLQAKRQRDVLSPRPILGALGQKYDQYLDFAQQDAHEFLRILLDAMRMEEQDIIKLRQPPPPQTHKKRRRTTIVPSDPSPTANSRLEHEQSSPGPQKRVPEEEKLMSFADMIFGGRLTSILVCQKCKHISQTYEDFNDISLSIKPEDYVHRKRDRLKNLAKRLTNFPSSSSSSGHSHTHPKFVLPEIQRPSSVPPSPKERPDAQLPAHDPLPTSSMRRKSLDIEATSEDQVLNETMDTIKDTAVVNDKLPRVEDGADEQHETASADSTDILVNVSGPEGKHVEFVEVPNGTSEKKEKKGKKEGHEDNWSKLSRRLSLTVGLGKPKDRKGRSADRAHHRASASILEGITQEDVDDSIGKRIFSDGLTNTGARPQSVLSSAAEALIGRAVSLDNRFMSSSKASLVDAPGPSLDNKNPPARSSSPLPVLHPDPGSSSSHHPHVPPRPKSPKPPKPSAAETEYLRKILADVAAGSSANPFAIFKQQSQHPTGIVHGSSTAHLSPHNVWLGINPLSGIEECLRMFTAVENLDGENMVGCRRCWKIANGVLPKSRNGDEDDDSDSIGPESPPTSQENHPNGQTKPPLSPHDKPVRPPPLPLQIPGVHGVHIPTSISTPTVSYYPQTEITDQNDTRSISSLPAAVSSHSLDISRTNSESNSSAESTPGGLPIPLISTTGPESSTDSTVPLLSEFHAAEESNIHVEEPSLSHPVDGVASPQATQPTANTLNFDSKDSLPVPAPSHHLRRRGGAGDATTTDEESSGDESETSVTTADSTNLRAKSSPQLAQSGSAPSASSTAAAAALSTSASASALPHPSPKKPSKPKPVIMRAAYKRYLIATPPPVLVIHLKRFQQLAKTPFLSFSHGFKKLDDYVTFPEYLDLTPFLAPKKEDYGLGSKKARQHAKTKAKQERCMYRLYAVVVHIGNMLGGHYIAYTALPTKSPIEGEGLATKPPPPPAAAPEPGPPAEGKLRSSTPPPDASQTLLPSALPSSTPTPTSTSQAPTPRQWAYISDTIVRLTTLEEVLNAKAYICMYERC